MSDIDLKESGYGVRVLPREILGGLLQQSSLRLHARDTQGTFKEYSKDIQGTFKEYSRDIQFMARTVPKEDCLRLQRSTLTNINIMETL